MMRYSEISRDLSTDNLRYSEVSLPRPQSPTKQVSIGFSLQLSRKPTTDYVGYTGQTYVTASPTQQARYQQQQQLQLQQQQQSQSPQQVRQTKQRSPNGNAHTMACLRQDKHQKELLAEQQAQQAAQQSAASKTLNIKSTRRKNSIGCLTSFSSSPDSPGCYYSIS